MIWAIWIWHNVDRWIDPNELLFFFDIRFDYSGDFLLFIFMFPFTSLFLVMRAPTTFWSRIHRIKGSGAIFIIFRFLRVEIFVAVIVLRSFVFWIFVLRIFVDIFRVAFLLFRHFATTFILKLFLVDFDIFLRIWFLFHGGLLLQHFFLFLFNLYSLHIIKITLSFNKWYQCKIFDEST